MLLSKYKCLRNKVTCQIRKENLDFNNNRIETAKSKSELRKIANDVIKPRNNDTIKLIIDGTKITDELEVAESFNNFFVKKIADLKEGNR